MMMTLRQQYSEIMRLPVNRMKSILESFAKFKEEEKKMIDAEMQNVKNEAKKNQIKNRKN